MKFEKQNIVGYNFSQPSRLFTTNIKLKRKLVGATIGKEGNLVSLWKQEGRRVYHQLFYVRRCEKDWGRHFLFTDGKQNSLGDVCLCAHTYLKQKHKETLTVESVYFYPQHLSLTLKARFSKQKHHINHRNKSYNYRLKTSPCPWLLFLS